MSKFDVPGASPEEGEEYVKKLEAITEQIKTVRDELWEARFGNKPKGPHIEDLKALLLATVTTDIVKMLKKETQERENLN